MCCNYPGWKLVSPPLILLQAFWVRRLGNVYFARGFMTLSSSSKTKLKACAALQGSVSYSHCVYGQEHPLCNGQMMIYREQWLSDSTSPWKWCVFVAYLQLDTIQTMRPTVGLNVVLQEVWSSGANLRGHGWTFPRLPKTHAKRKSQQPLRFAVTWCFWVTIQCIIVDFWNENPRPCLLCHLFSLHRLCFNQQFQGASIGQGEFPRSSIACGRKSCISSASCVGSGQ